jgi:hypothetical protein
MVTAPLASLTLLTHNSFSIAGREARSAEKRLAALLADKGNEVIPRWYTT